MFKKLICAAILLAGSAVTAMADPILGFSPSAIFTSPGNDFNIDLTIAGVTDLYGWQLDVSFGPAGLLNALAVSEGLFFGPGTTFGSGVIDNSTATIPIIFDRLSGPSGISGSGVLAHILFHAMTQAVANLALSNIQLVDSNLDSIFPDTPTAATVTVTVTNSVTVTNTPEPSTFVFLAVSLAACSLLRQRLQRTDR